MTVYERELLFGGFCDNCRTYVPAGSIAWYNPKTKKIYCHDGCLDNAEIGKL